VNSQLGTRRQPEHFEDPRESQGAEVIDLATRAVLPAVSARRPRSDGMGLAAGVALVALLGGVTLWSMNAAREDAKQPRQAAVQTGPAVPAAAPAVPPQAITPARAASPSPLPAPAPQAVLAAAPQANAGLAARPGASPTVVFDASAMPAPLAGPAVPGAPAGTGNSNDDFAARLGVTGAGNGAATATAMIDPRTTVTQGTLIPAVLETAIDTDVPGYVRAVVSADVRSFDGSRVLVPRSSRLVGQYKSGLQAGQKRAYVIWTRLIRPDGVSVALGSPAVTFSGETGLAGKVNSHFFERFGSAMLLSVVGGLSALGGNAGVIIGGSGQSAAAAAVGQSGQIGPTIRVRQGEPIRVFTAKDLDFSKVTKL
jgi:type IV secretion system protein VirB10